MCVCVGGGGGGVGLGGGGEGIRNSESSSEMFRTQFKLQSVSILAICIERHLTNCFSALTYNNCQQK